MPMTSLMSHIANGLEARLRPGLHYFVLREYRERSGKEPTELRANELMDACINSMRLKLEECYDLKSEAGDVHRQCMKAIRLALATELDKEFPKVITT